MSRFVISAMRRAKRLMQPSKARSAGAGAAVKAVLAPLAVLKPKSSARRKKANKPKTGTTLGMLVYQLRLAQAFLPASPTSSPSKAPTIPKGASYLSRTHRTAAGSRSYKIYVPSGQHGRAKGLILMLHGCKQNPDDFALGTNMNAHAEKHGLAVVYPAQEGRDNPAACWNWFKPSNQTRGTGEPALLASLTRKLMKEHGLDRTSVFVAGLSAGGAMAAILADVYPDLFSAAGIHSGLARGSANDVLSALSAMRYGGAVDAALSADAAHFTRRIIFHGDADSTVHPSNAAALVVAALGADATPSRISRRSVQGGNYARSEFSSGDGTVDLALWILEGAGHAWSGGKLAGSYTDKSGPDASAQMVRFFMSKTN